MTNYCSPCEGKHIGGCNQITDSRCIYYNPEEVTPSQLMCFLNVENNTSVHEILETLDAKLCEYLSVTVIPCFRDLIDIPLDETPSINEFLIHLQEYICNSLDEKVKVSANDAEAGYLFDKITVDIGLEKTLLVNEDGTRSVHISINPQGIYDLIKDLIEVPNCYEIDCSSCEDQPDCTPQPLIPVITKSTDENGVAILSCTSCNGVVSWYNEEDELIAYGNATPVVGGTYYAVSETVCGRSENSNTITIPPYSSFTYVKTTTFNRNNCPDNGCGMPCIGSNVVFSKTYISHISEAHAQQLANTDVTYPTQGQQFANLNGSCECPSCECLHPMYVSANRTNPTCNGLVLQSNGSVNITGLTNATKFGYSFNTIGYEGPNFTNAYSLGYNSANISSTSNSITLSGLSVSSVIMRIFNNEANCYKDLVFTFVVPNCNPGNSNISLGSMSVSC